MTGQNKVWCAGIGIVKGLLYDDQVLIERSVEDIWSELRVSTEEGIQPDWSFHQHGPQQQFGNYGLSFGRDMIQWASILRSSEYELSGDKLSILRNYMLNGVSWVGWNGFLDFNACGRQIDRGYQLVKGSDLLRQLERMKQVDPQFAADYAATQKRVGFKAFWRSEMAVQRRPDWYASLKMSSTRVVGAESVNSENMLGLHMGDGVLLIYLDGSEYEDLPPLWDWKRLPGTTCDQGLTELTPNGSRDSFGGSDFSGVLGSGDTGLAAMIYQRGNLTARKSWFFFTDHIVCLGSGISGETKGNVYTSVEQARLRGDVFEDEGSVCHGQTIYEFLDCEPVIAAGTVSGNWNRVYPVRGDRPETDEVFSLWIDHGKSPKGSTYAYRIAPVCKEGANPFRSEVLQNSETLQAVQCGDAVYAAFYEAGVLKFGDGPRIEVSAPCLLIADPEKVTVSDPTHTLQSLDINVDGKTLHIDLPPGAEQGKPVKVALTRELSPRRQFP
jgi:chondroitin AC lyase